jgi:hypothetical protein
MGWESLLYGVPTAALGECFYQEPSVAFRPASYDELAHFAAHSPKPDPEGQARLAAFIVALHEETKPGNFSRPAHDPGVLSAENVSRISDLIAHSLS